MFGDWAYGEATVSETVSPPLPVVLDAQALFMYGNLPSMGSTSLFINGFYYPNISFALITYIEGHDRLHNNEEDTWGTEAEAEAEIAEIGDSNIVNIYEPKHLYVGGKPAVTISSSRLAYIVMKAKLMDVPTEDGKTNPIANRATDVGPHANDILLFRGPEWVIGPHD